MPIAKTEELFDLIKSLTKAEKRNFRLFAKRYQEDTSLLFLKLFDVLDKQVILDDKDVKRKIPLNNASQYANVKRHLYTQIITSLKKLYIRKKASIEIRDLMDYASILQSKGLISQALKILDKASVMAKKTQYEILHLHIIEYQKLLESRHITRSGASRSIELIEAATDLNGIVHRSIKLSNLKMLLHGQYIKFGHVKNQKEEDQLKSLLDAHLSNLDLTGNSPIEDLYLFQSYVWFYYILLDFANCYYYSRKWVELFQKHPGLIRRDPGLYMRGYHYLLTSAYGLGDVKRFESHLAEFELYRKMNYKRFDKNNQIISFLYVHTGRLNQFIIRKEFKQSLGAIPGTLKRLTRYKRLIDNHRVLIFYYKIAWLYLNASRPDKSLDFLNKIRQMNKLTLRKDIQVYAHLMHIMAHYDLGNSDLLPYLTTSAKKFVEKMGFSNTLIEYTLDMFSKCSKSPERTQRKILKDYHVKFQKLRKNKYEKRALLYLEMNHWLAGK